MPIDPPMTRLRDRLRVGVFVFLLSLTVGGGAGTLMFDGFRQKVEETARRDATIIGTSVARALALQFEKAARFGIPLKLLPGVEAYLSDTMAQTPGITRIVLRGPDGREARFAIGPVPGGETVSVPIQVDTIPVGQVDVTTAPATLSTALSVVYLPLAGAVFICALISGVLGALFAGSALAESRIRLVALLTRNVGGELDSGPGGARMGQGAIARAYRAASAGVHRVADKWLALQAYAEELLAVDFEGGLRADVERIRREAMPRSQGGTSSKVGRGS
ncbi:hypothetical protein V5F77_05635 [Xanthobacter sp. DSM 24535]|uniref:hypothetical protein n=1 Tax=Roseixanthobacter psychrophilus TaxID=3119917 RepID=UPI00372BC963